MKEFVSRLSNERLEDSIAALYQGAAREFPGLVIQETGDLALLWTEFDQRIQHGRIDRDTDWEPEEWYD